MTSAKVEVVEVDFKETYPLRERVLWPGRPDLAALACDPQGRHWGIRMLDAKNESGELGELVSVMSLFVTDDGREAQFRKFATAPEQQHRGLGSMLLQHVIEEARQQGVQRLWCDARATQAQFYEKRGMHAVEGGAIFLKSGVEYIRMEMQL